MGIGLSLYSALEVFQICWPTTLEAMTGRVRRHVCDERLQRFSARIVAKARIQLEVIGADAVPQDRTHIYMSNHQSHLDIPVLYQTIPARTVRMVAKTELFHIPVLAHGMRAAEFIEIDRRNRRQAVAELGRAAERIRSGVNVWIAPEGTRSRDGALRPLKRGGFHLAVQTGTPIIPVAISGTREVLPPGSLSMRAGVPVRVVFGPEIAVEGRTVSELTGEVERFLRAQLEQRAA